MRSVIKGAIFVIISLVLITGLRALLQVISEHPPLEEVIMARNAISEAKRNGAESYSPKTLREAQALYDLSIEKWKLENEKFISLRDFGDVRKTASESFEKAKVASDYSLKTSGSMKVTEKEKIDMLRERVKISGPLFNRLPLPENVKNNNARGRLLLGEAEIAYNNGDLIKSRNLLIEAKDLINDSFDYSGDFLVDYFKAYPDWKRWVDKTIENSRKQKSYAIVVDKFGRKVMLYYSGVLKNTFDAELGRNWIGHKKIRGDLTTPEGQYTIVKKKSGGETKYYKALLINYPSKQDMDAFQKEKSNGSLPGNASIGNLIEIHGEGGKGGDWTEGCIAMTNKDMDVLFRVIQTGTPITIVGSLKPLNEIVKQVKAMEEYKEKILALVCQNP